MIKYFLIIDKVYAKSARVVQTEIGIFENIGEFISEVFKKIMPMVGGIALLVLIYAGYLYMTSQGNQEQISRAKELIVGALVGIVLLFTIGVILQQVVGVRVP